MNFWGLFFTAMNQLQFNAKMASDFVWGTDKMNAG